MDQGGQLRPPARRVPYAPEVITLYRQAGLNLNRDLKQLTRNANITADPAAVRSLEQTSVPTGRIQVPELDMHTISDQLVPVQQENYYRHTVAFAGRSELLRQAFIQRQLHCNFNPSELVAGVLAVQHRVNTGHWDSVATPTALEARATSLAAADPSLGAAAFIPFFPPPLSGNNGPFDPCTGGTGRAGTAGTALRQVRIRCRAAGADGRARFRAGGRATTA